MTDEVNPMIDSLDSPAMPLRRLATWLVGEAPDREIHLLVAGAFGVIAGLLVALTIVDGIGTVAVAVGLSVLLGGGITGGTLFVYEAGRRIGGMGDGRR